MSEYLKMLHEIEAKKEILEKRINELVQVEIEKFQAENELPVKDVYISLSDVTGLGELKRYIVNSVSVDIDYKP